MITFSANIRKATAKSNDAITTSSVGIPVTLMLASEFNGLAKTVIFKAGAVAVDVVLTGDQTETVVPPDVLTVAGEWLRIGIYAADNDGNVVIPTVWASPGVIAHGATPSGVDPSAPTPSWVAQVQSIASQASEDASDALTIAQGVKAQADAGDFDGAPGQDGTDGTDGYSPTVSVKDIPGGHEVTITDINGEHSFEVLDGQGGGGSSDYNDLSNKPQIAGTTLSGNKSLADLGIAAASDIPAVPVQSVNSKTGSVVLDASDVGALPTGGGTMTGAIAMGGYKITGIGTPQNDGDAATKKYVDDAITGIGTVFNIKGDVAAVSDLPASGNTVGDVYYVQAVSAAYVWLETTAHPTGYWEEFGEPIDLSGYIEKPTSPTANQYLKWDGTAWVAADAPVTSVNGNTGAVNLSIPSSASDVGAVAVAQGVGHAGEFCVVGSDGNITTMTLSTWQGGSY